MKYVDTKTEFRLEKFVGNDSDWIGQCTSVGTILNCIPHESVIHVMYLDICYVILFYDHILRIHITQYVNWKKKRSCFNRTARKKQRERCVDVFGESYKFLFILTKIDFCRIFRLE